MNKMNKWITISAISVLAIGVIATGVLYAKESSELKGAQSDIAALESDVTTLEGNATTLEVDLAAAKAQVATLETDLRAAKNEVVVRARAFSPPIINVLVGTTVTWINLDPEEHSVTSFTSLFNRYLNLHATFSYTFTEPGTYNYHCIPHHHMMGTVIVE